MAVPSKAVREVVEEVAPVVKGAPPASAARQVLNEPVGKQQAQRAMDQIFEEHNQSVRLTEEDAAAMSREHSEMIEQVYMQEPPALSVRQQLDRDETLFDKDAEVSFGWQTADGDEFALRLEDQLTNSKYLHRWIQSRRQGLEHLERALATPDEIEESFKAWNDANQKMLGFFDTPQGQAVVRWSEGTPYTRGAVFGDPTDTADLPIVWYHVDIMTDPAWREGTGAIQHTLAANEFGLHLGTGRAATDIMGRKSVSFIQKSIIEEAFGELDQIIKQEYGLGDVDLMDLYKKALKVQMENQFQRPGFRPNWDAQSLRGEFRMALEDAVNYAFEDIRLAIREKADNNKDWLRKLQADGVIGAAEVGYVLKNINGLLRIQNPEQFTSRMLANLMNQFDASGYPMVVKAENALVLPDIINWEARNIARELQSFGIFRSELDVLELDAIAQTFDDIKANHALEQFLTDRGYDHIFYINEAENAGTPSILVFGLDKTQNLYTPTLKGAKISNESIGGRALAEAVDM